MEGAWIKELQAAITVCDKDGIIVEMNDQSARNFAKDGGRELIGSSVLDCHPEKARDIITRMLANRAENIYTTEKDGLRKLVCQKPWYQEGQFMGLVEFIIELPPDMPHFKR